MSDRSAAGSTRRAARSIPRVEESLSEAVIDPRFTNRERQPGLDLLRALAIIVVVVYHAGIMGFPLPGRVHRFGWVGVDLFFVLSGYLIGGQLFAPLARGQGVNLRRFFARRALRIMPAYFVILTIYFLLPSWREYPEISPLWKFLISVQNIGLHGGTAFSHAWSLAVEDQFYLLLPLILLLANRWRPHERDHSLRHRSRWNRAARISCLAEPGRNRRLLPRLSNMDLLCDLDPARSARLRRRPGCDRKIPAATIVATPDEFRSLALVARTRTHHLRIIYGRN
jgi:hypothetical protein